MVVRLDVRTTLKLFIEAQSSKPMLELFIPQLKILGTEVINNGRKAHSFLKGMNVYHNFFNGRIVS